MSSVAKQTGISWLYLVFSFGSSPPPKVLIIALTIIGNTIIKVNDEYYVVVELNVNLWSPYELYKYSKEKNKLKLIYTFYGEEVIGIKNK